MDYSSDTSTTPAPVIPPPAMIPRNAALIFDAYGTILNTEELRVHIVSYMGDREANKVLGSWNQLRDEYLWVQERFEQFEDTIKTALEDALLKHNWELAEGALPELAEAYDLLPLHADVKTFLQKWDEQEDTDSLHLVAFSGEHREKLIEQLNRAMGKSCEEIFDLVLSGAGEGLEAVLEQVGENTLFDAEEIDGAQGGVDTLDCMWIISASPTTCVAAIKKGAKAIWVDRNQDGWDLNHRLHPTEIVDSLDVIPMALRDRKELSSDEKDELDTDAEIESGEEPASGEDLQSGEELDSGEEMETDAEPDGYDEPPN